jgi:uncharacterized integral membrane protein
MSERVNDLWLKIKMWTKIVVFGLLVLYTLVFVLKNSDRSARFWYWFYRDYEIPILFMVLFTFAAGVLATVLIWTTMKTLRQFRNLRVQSRTDRLEREVADMKAKAAILQTRASGSAETIPPESTRNS